jgi:hypothetical protein
MRNSKRLRALPSMEPLREKCEIGVHVILHSDAMVATGVLTTSFDLVDQR